MEYLARAFTAAIKVMVLESNPTVLQLRASSVKPAVLSATRRAIKAKRYGKRHINQPTTTPEGGKKGSSVARRFVPLPKKKKTHPFARKRQRDPPPPKKKTLIKGATVHQIFSGASHLTHLFREKVASSLHGLEPEHHKLSLSSCAVATTHRVHTRTDRTNGGSVDGYGPHGDEDLGRVHPV